MQRACGCCREHKVPTTAYNGLPTRPVVSHIVESRLRQAWLLCRALEEAWQPWSEALRSLRTRVVGCCSKSGSFKLVRGSSGLLLHRYYNVCGHYHYYSCTLLEYHSCTLLQYYSCTLLAYYSCTLSGIYGPPHYYYLDPLIIVYSISVSLSYNHHTQLVAPRSRKKRRQIFLFFRLL